MSDPKVSSATRSAIERWLIQELAARLDVPTQEIDTRRPVAAYGLQSVDMVGLVGDLEELLGRELSATLLWEYPTIEAIAEFLGSDSDRHGEATVDDLSQSAGAAATTPAGTRAATPAEAMATISATGDVQPEPIAVIGIGCRFPGGADNPRDFWRLLCDGWDAVTEVPADRWSIEDFVDDDPAVPGKTNTRWGGFLDGVDRFDAQFFGISPREAERMDPQQRLLAEVTWEAIEDAGLSAEKLAGSATGVFVGIATTDYAMLQVDDLTRIDAHYGTGNATSIAANRLSYLFDLRGPSMAIDTACSSSLVALHQACESLASGDCSLALAGGVNLILSPALAINFTKAGAMAPDGRCKTFDARANGYVRSEGAGVVVLKPMSRAIADRDPIYGVILGGAVNQDGRTNGLMAPNPHAQEAVLRAAYARAGVAPTQVRYVEAHGTGTLLGDPIEVKALSAVLGRDRDPAAPCLIGSVKSNIGHLEAAAGIAGLIKTLLTLRNRTIPPSIHYEQPNPHIPFDELAVRVVDSLRPWPDAEGPAIAGVSSFGFGGTNAHIVLGEPPAPAPLDSTSDRQSAQLLTISARSPEALRELAVRYESELAQSAAELTPRALTAAAALRRTHHEYRLACVGFSIEQLREGLDAFVRDEERPGLSSDARRLGRQPKVAFVFAGQGPRWWPLGADLLRSEPVLARVLDRCDALLRREVEWSLLEQLTAGEHCRLSDPAVAQPALCAMQIALAELWRSWGIEPSVVVGHSVGEIAAAQVAGALELTDALRIAVHRGQVIGRAAEGGGMAVVGLSLPETEKLLDRLKPESVWIAASNAPESTVLSGDAKALDHITATLETEGIFSRRLESVTFASHSPAMEPLSAELGELLTGLRGRTNSIPILSTVTGELIDGDQMGARYWAANLRKPVLFDPAITALAESGHEVFVEISPHPMLGEAIRERLELQDTSGVAVASVRREESVRESMLSGLGQLYTAGFPVDWQRLHGDEAVPMVALPSYSWQRQRYWLDEAVVRVRRKTGEHPLLDTHLVSAAGSKAHHWSARVDLTGLPYLRDHCVRGTAVLPAAMVLDAALAAARQVLDVQDVELHNVEFTGMVLVDDNAMTETVQLVLTPEAGTAGSFTLFARSGVEATGGEWAPLAAGGYRSSTQGDQDPSDGSVVLDKARGHCSQPVDRDGHYQRLRGFGLEYGEAFQGIESLWQAPGQAVARIREPEVIAGDRDPYVVHPAVLDSCLQVLGAALAAGDTSTQRTYLPVAVGQFRVADSKVRPVWAYATTFDAEPSPTETISGTVVLFDEAGNWVGEVEGVVLRQLDRADDTNAVAESLFQYRWREVSDEVTGHVDPSAGWWLLFADRDGVSDQLRTRLADAGATCVTVCPGPRWQRTGDSEYEIDPARREDFSALLVALRANQPGRCLAVVHAWSLDADLTDTDAPDLLTTVQDLGCVSTLHLVQELAEGALGGVSRLVMLTRGAQQVAEDDGLPSIAQGALWGLARVVAVEHGDLRPAVIDLDPRRPAGEVDGLLTELTSTGVDDQICLRAGKRYRPALERWSASVAREEMSAPRPFDPKQDENFQLVAVRPGILESMRPVVCGRSKPGPHEIEIEVSAGGLNFSDVLKAMDLYPGMEPGILPLGAECAGRVSAVGSEVKGYQVGDRVMAIAKGSFSAFTTTAEHLVARTPDVLTDEQAAASPIAFMTAIHGLEYLARLQPGESVLIHSATGGVGLAALQIAKRQGAEIYATAGTEQKRDLLRSLGIQHVMDSRSLRFAEEIMEATQGRGVDVVLNSLAGEALTRSVSVLAEGGRFVEIGKQDIYANSHLGLARFKFNRSFFAVDLERSFAQQPAHVSYLFQRLAQGFADGEFNALPMTTFAMSEAETAFSLMARAQHTGKVVLSRTGSETVIAATDATPVTADGSYVVTGGLGALGLETAKYLIDQGARHLVLMGRSKPSAEVQSTLAELTSRATITVFQGDVSSGDDIAAMMSMIDRELPPLRGVIHAAGYLDDGLLVQLDQRRLRSVMAPKMAGAWHLHRATVNRDLDFFVLYSSAAALLGSPSQGNYAAANAFLDSLAVYRHAQGLPAQSINWGPWSEIGLAATPDRGGQLADRGIASISPHHGIDALHVMLPSSSPQVVVLPLDRPKLQAAAAAGLLPRLLTDFVADFAPSVAAADESAGIRGRMLAVEPGRRRRDILTAHVRLTMAQVLKLDPARVETDTPLASLGFDSLMSLELRKRLETTLGVQLPATLAWRYPTVEAIVPFLAEQMGISLVGEVRTVIESDDTASESPADGELDLEPEADLDDLSDDDIEAMLLAKLQDIEEGF